MILGLTCILTRVIIAFVCVFFRDAFPTRAGAAVTAAPTLLGHPRIAVAMVQPDLALAVEERIEDLAVAVVLPPGAQLPVPHAVQPIDQAGHIEAEQRVVVLVAQVAAELVLVHQPLDVLLPQHVLEQLRLSDALQIQHDHARIQARIAVLGALGGGDGDAVAVRRARLRRAGRVVRLAEAGGRIAATVFVQHVVIDGRQFRRQAEQVVRREAERVIGMAFFVIGLEIS